MLTDYNLLICFVVILICYFTFNYFEPMTNTSVKPTWKRNKCKYLLNQTLQNVLDENGIIETHDATWSLYLPCTYDDMEKEIKTIDMKQLRPNSCVFMIDNADQMACKELLWTNILTTHGYEKALKLMPNTYVLNSTNDTDRIISNHSNKSLYIMKKNEQRQEGLKITRSLDEILNGHQDGFVVAQDLLQNPYTIKERKTNMRFYVLVVCNKNTVSVYVYNDGFMYYTKELFERDSDQIGPNITTGYIDRWVYDVHPLTHTDFKKYLDQKDRTLTQQEKHVKDSGRILSEYVFQRIFEVIATVFGTFIPKIINSKLKDCLSFQLFGVDIAVHDDLQPLIMEINKGPDMGAKDERDGQVKKGCVLNILRTVGIIKDKPSEGFIKLL